MVAFYINKKYFYIFIFFGLGIIQSLIANSKEAHVFETTLSFIPETAGSFFSGEDNSYFAVFERTITILNKDFIISSAIRFSKNISAFDFGDINGDGYDDLIEFGPEGVFVRYQNNNSNFIKREKINIKEYFFAPYYTVNVERITLGADIDNDKDFDLILPGVGKFYFFENNLGRYIKKSVMPFDFISKFSDRVWKNSDRRSNTVRAQSFIPRLYFKDLNNDTILDAYCRTENKVYFYLSQLQKNNIMPFNQTILRVFPVELSEVYASYVEVDDLNNDNNPDLIFSIIKGLGLKIRTEIFVFWGKNFIPDSSNKTFFIQQGGFFSPLVASFNMKKKLIIPTIDPGVTFFINYIVRRKILINAAFLSIENKQIVEENNVSLSFDAEGSLFPGFTTGDFNADSNTDFVLGHTLREMAIYKGDNSHDVEFWQNINVPSYGILKTVTNPAGKDELIIFLPQVLEEYDRKKIFLVRFAGE
ncbi:MAG: VCBS repeat-containing protein [Spirochaetia bacterium]|nr:VCBS repeat-containing protein [Spirochaetia bacterium]